MAEFETKQLRTFLTQYQDIVPIEPDKSYKLVTISNKGIVRLRDIVFGTKIKTDKACCIKKGTFIYSRLAAHTGSFGLVPPELDGAIVSNEMPVFEIDTSIILPGYFLFYIRQPRFLNTLFQLTKGMGRVRIKENSFLDIELLIHKEIYEQQKILDSLNVKTRLVEGIKTTFLNQIDALTSLRQQILQKAIEGKLTAKWRQEQTELISGENHASKLLENIKAEKEKLIQEKKLKKETTQEPAYSLPINIPKEWVSCTILDISKQVTDGTHQVPTYVKDGQLFLSAQNIKPFKFLPDNHQYITKAAFDLYRKNRIAEKDDLLIARVGAGIGETAILDRDIEFAFYVSLGLIKIFKQFINPNYLAIVFNSPYGVAYSKGNVSSSGTSAGNYNLGRIRAFKIPLPSLFEQEEVVTRVNTLSRLIYKLEKQVSDRKELAVKLMQSVLREAFATS